MYVSMSVYNTMILQIILHVLRMYILKYYYLIDTYTHLFKLQEYIEEGMCQVVCMCIYIKFIVEMFM